MFDNARWYDSNNGVDEVVNYQVMIDAGQAPFVSDLVYGIGAINISIPNMPVVGEVRIQVFAFNNNPMSSAIRPNPPLPSVLGIGEFTIVP